MPTSRSHPDARRGYGYHGPRNSAPGRKTVSIDEPKKKDWEVGIEPTDAERQEAEDSRDRGQEYEAIVDELFGDPAVQREIDHRQYGERGELNASEDGH